MRRWSGNRLSGTALPVALAAVVGLAVAGCDSAAGPAGAPASAARQVTVVGTGEVQGVPDTLTADVAIESQAPDVTTAMNRTSERQQAVFDALGRAGVDRKDIATTGVSVQPQYRGDGTVVPEAYRASNSVAVTVRKLDAASAALAAIVAAGGDATRINGVNYRIDDDSGLVRDARARAFADARSRAEQYATLSGLRLGPVVTISETPVGAPAPPQPLPRAMVADVPLSPGTQKVGFSVTAVWELT